MNSPARYTASSRGVTGDRRRARNVVVATGTGSGKTECFLYPILDALLKRNAGGAEPAGRGALLVYPLNALGMTSFTSASFRSSVDASRRRASRSDRFTGLTRDDAKGVRTRCRTYYIRPVAKSFAFGENIPGNWQLTRHEMLGASAAHSHYKLRDARTPAAISEETLPLFRHLHAAVSCA